MSTDPLNPQPEEGWQKPDWLVGAGDDDGVPPPSTRRETNLEHRRAIPMRPPAAMPTRPPGPPGLPAPATRPEAQRLSELVSPEIQDDSPAPLPGRGNDFGMIEPAFESADSYAPELSEPAAPAAAAHAPAGEPAAPGAWQAAASSIPTLKRRRGDAPAHHDSALDPEVSAAFEEGPTEAARVEAQSAPAQREHVAPPQTLSGVLERVIQVGARLMPLAARVPRVGWIVAAGVVALIVTIVVVTRPRQHFERVRTIREHAQAFDGKTVNVRGVVGQVFAVGAGYAFYLHQDRDTIVVYSRGTAPSERDRVRLAGTVSTGFLDGIPRAAIFEDERLEK